MTDDDTLTFKDVFRHDLVEKDFVNSIILKKGRIKQEV